MHSLIMLAFTKAMHGPDATKVVWRALLDDKKGFVPAVRAMGSAHERVFLPCVSGKVIRNSQVCRPQQGRRLWATWTRLSNQDSSFKREFCKKPNVHKLVTLVTGGSNSDTRIFDIDRTFDDAEEAEARAAMQQVKQIACSAC